MWTRSAERVLDHLRPKPVSDTATHELVRAKLALVSEHPERIAVGVEHGCVTLAGALATHERGKVVRAISKVHGVDSVVDLLHEENDLAPAAPRPHRALRVSRADRPLALRIAALGTGAGLAAAGLKLGGRIGFPLALLGTLLAVGGATDVKLRYA
jgi:hypothetical protein